MSPFTSMLESLTRQRGVRASLIVSENDGLIVDSNLRFGQDGDRIAALAASMYRKARLSAGESRSSRFFMGLRRKRCSPDAELVAQQAGPSSRPGSAFAYLGYSAHQ